MKIHQHAVALVPERPLKRGRGAAVRRIMAERDCDEEHARFTYREMLKRRGREAMSAYCVRALNAGY